MTDGQGIPLYAHVSDLSGTKKPYVLPVPFMNVLNGGYSFSTIRLEDNRADNDILRSHAGGRLAFQEFMIVPS